MVTHERCLALHLHLLRWISHRLGVRNCPLPEALMREREFLVPFRVTLQGNVFVKAESILAAKSIVDNGFSDPGFYDTAEMVDWEVAGEPRPCIDEGDEPEVVE